MKELWRKRSFRWYWLGLFLSGLGDQMGWMALSWGIMLRTNSPAAMGGIILAYTLPAVFAGLVAGVLLDRYERRRLIVIDNVLRATIFAVLFILLQMETVPLFVIYVLVVLAGMLSPLSSAGAQTMLPTLVSERHLLTKANAVMETQWQMVYLVGPAAAGVLIGWLGFAHVLLLDALGFLLCAICFSRLPGQVPDRLQKKAGEQQPSFGIYMRELLGDIRFGYRFVFGRKQMLVLIFFTFFFNMAYGPFEVALPLYANEDLRVGAEGLGLLWSSLAVGALLGSMLFAAVPWKIPTGTTLAAIIVIWGLATLPLALFTRLDIALVAMGIAGLSFSPYNILYRSYLQRQVPDELLGRVLTSIRTITGTGMPAGAAVSGLLIPYVGVSGLFMLGSFACMAVGLLAFFLLRGVEQAPSLPVE
ncbi:MFS transporter [Brevibacillus sp. TJ4]|uniref:MFS transporter n=1 Tax=Brevibacillus sp. TJ4 TaxID=3234853 RepID=UPI003BA03A04